MLQLLEDDDFGLSEENNSDFEGEDVESYLPRVDPGQLDFEDIVSDDSSSSSDKSVTQPLGKYYCS